MIELRCKRCGALLLKESIVMGTVEVKCHRCNTFNTLSVDKMNHGLTNDLGINKLITS
jgi:phage FluMu protein Com